MLYGWFLLSLSLFLFAASASASGDQDAPSRPDARVLFDAGLLLGRMDEPGGDSGEDHPIYTGFRAGAALVIPQAPSVNIVFGLHYEWRGARTEKDVLWSNWGGMGDPRPERWAQQVEVGYLTFSVLPGVARATGSIRPYARLGGVLGIPITEHAEFVREGLDYRYSHSFEEDQVETELDPAIRLEAGSEFQASSILCRIGVGYTHGYGTVDIRHRQTDGPSIRFSGARNRAVDLVIGLDLNP